MVDGSTWPTGNTGAVKVMFADEGPVDVTCRLTSAGAPVWTAVNVRACAGTFGSVPVTGRVPGAPEKSVMGSTWLTVGWRAALMVMVALALAVPQAFVAESVAVTGEVAPIAENTPLPTLFGVTLPLETAQSRVTGAVPVELPASVTVPPAATVYGPPAFAVGATQAGIGMTLEGHGLSTPDTRPVLEG